MTMDTARMIVIAERLRQMEKELAEMRQHTVILGIDGKSPYDQLLEAGNLLSNASWGIRDLLRQQ